MLRFAERLRKDGIDAQIDQYVGGRPPGGWPRWMLDKLDWADFVLLVCTKTYYRRFRGHEDPDKGKGVDWEGQLITIEIYHAKSRTTKFVPVIFGSEDKEFIPEPLSDQFYLLDSEDHYHELYSFLIGQAGVLPARLGSLKTPARRQVDPLNFGRSGAQEASAGTVYHVPDLALHDLPPAEGIGRQITLLHVSDMQFGRHLQFVPEPDAPPNEFDTLLERIWSDIALLRDKEGLKPDLLICTGDLAEWAWPKEFADAASFLGDPPHRRRQLLAAVTPG